MPQGLLTEREPMMLWLYLILLGMLGVIFWLIIKAGAMAAKDSKYMEHLMTALDGELEAMSSTRAHAKVYRHQALLNRLQYKNLNECDRALEENPQSTKAHVDRAALQLSHQSYNEAIKDCNQALRINSNSGEAYHCRGLAYQMKGENEQAILDLSEAADIEPNNPDIFVARALAFYHLMEYPLALNDCQTALEINPQHQGAYVVRSLVLSTTGEPQAAFMDCQRAMRLGSPHSLLLVARAFALSELNENLIALRDCSTALEWDEDESLAYAVRAKVHFNLAEHQKAAEDCEQARRRLPENLWIQNLQAWMLATSPEPTLRDGPKAMNISKRLCEGREETHPELLDTLAAACAEIDDFDQAVHWQQKAMSSPRYRESDKDKARQRLKQYQKGLPWRQQI